MKTVLTLILLCATLSISAQEDHAKRQERIRTYKIGYITEQLSLSPEEAQAFWPIYNELDEKGEKLREGEFKALRNYRKNGENISEQEAQEIVSTILEAQQRRVDHKKELAQRLKDILPVKKTLALFKAEEDFKRKLLRELRDRRGSNKKN